MKNVFIARILNEVQNLEEIGGPDTIEEYAEILEVVKAEVDKRLASAKEQIAEKADTLCIACDKPITFAEVVELSGDPFGLVNYDVGDETSYYCKACAAIAATLPARG